MKKILYPLTTLALMIFLFAAFQNASSADKAQALAINNTDSAAAEKADHDGVKAAILDYVEGIYNVDSTRIERSVHKEMRKRGYWFNPKKKAYHDNLDMSYEQLVGLAARWNKSGKKANAESPKKIDIYDVNDRTASAKLTAEWGIDYFHLANIDGKWYIMNVLWQSMPDDSSKS